METKHCAKCKEAKALSGFYPMGDGGHRSYCRECEIADVMERERRRRGTFRQKCAVALDNSRKRTRKIEAETGRHIENTLTLAEVMLIFAAGECAYCGTTLDQKELTLDHVIPLRAGGTNTTNNIVAACKSCNSSKGERPAFYYVWKMQNPRSAKKLFGTLAIRQGTHPTTIMLELRRQAQEYGNGEGGAAQ